MADDDEPDWLKSAGGALEAPPGLSKHQSEQEPEWLASAATTLMLSPPRQEDSELAQATARAEAAEAELRRLRKELRRKETTPRSRTKKEPSSPAAGRSAAAMDAKITAARAAGDEALLRGLLQEAARRAMRCQGSEAEAGGEAASRSARSGTPGTPSTDASVLEGGPADGGRAAGGSAAPAEAPRPSSPFDVRGYALSAFDCPSCGAAMAAELKSKLNSVECPSCGFEFAVKRPPRVAQQASAAGEPADG